MQVDAFPVAAAHEHARGAVPQTVAVDDATGCHPHHRTGRVVHGHLLVPCRGVNLHALIILLPRLGSTHDSARRGTRMTARRIMGTEIEYGISVPGDSSANPVITSTQVVLAYAAAADIPRSPEDRALSG